MAFNILKLRVKDAVEDQSLTYIASTFDPYDQVINDGVYENGRKLITFSSVLQHGVVPLPEILQMSMKYGAGRMRRPVEIEFACNIPIMTGLANSIFFRFVLSSMPRRCLMKM